MDTIFIIIGFAGGIISFIIFMSIITSNYKIGTVFLLLTIGLFVIGFIGMERDHNKQQIFEIHCEQILEAKNVIQYLKDNC